MRDQRFARFAVSVLVFNVAVVLFGAVVRATESGAGCGANWPTCEGVFTDGGPQAATLVEFSHRATSGIALVLVAVLAVTAVKSRPRGDAARWMALASAVLILNEALIGAALVLFEWVADDESLGRVLSIVVHLVNTFLLLGALTLTAWFGSGRPVPTRPIVGRRARLLRWAAVSFVIVGAMGAITALGDTLFPPESVGAGWFDDLGGTFIVRLRWVHPVAATITAGYLLWLVNDLAESPFGRLLGAAVYLQVALGIINVALLAPVWMQVTHLLVADVVWVSLVLTAADSLATARTAPV